MLIPEAVYFVAGYWALVLLVSAVCTYEWRATRRLARQLEHLDGLLEQCFSGNQIVDTRIEELEKHIRRLCECQSKLALSGEGRSFDLAIDLVRQGGDMEKLVSRFGLSQGEARLVALMHGRESPEDAPDRRV